MYCSNCGHKMEDNEKFCPECGLKVEKKKSKKVETAVIVDNNNPKEEKRYVKSMDNPTFLCVLSLICKYGSGLLYFIIYMIEKFIPILGTLSAIISSFVFLAPIAAWVLVIYARVHYKESKFPKILLIIYIIQLVLTVIAVIFLIFACVGALSDCGDAVNSLFMVW